MFEIILGFGLAWLIGTITTIALYIVAWVAVHAIQMIAGLVRKIGQKIAQVRTGKELHRFADFMKKASENDPDKEKRKQAIAVLDKLKAGNMGIVTGVNDDNEEDFTQLKVVQAENNERDLPDSFIVSEDGNWVKM